MGNALSWFKEYALRSQTADALAGVKEQAHADAANMLGALQERQWNVEEQGAKADLLLANEEIQQAGLTERERIQERVKAQERAAALVRQKWTDLNTDIDNAGKLDDEAAVDKFFEAIRGMGREVPQGVVDSLKASIKAKRDAKVAEDAARGQENDLRFAGGLSTEAGVRQWIKGNPKYEKDPRVQALLVEARAKDAERALRNREKPEKPEKGELTPTERLAYEKRVDELEAMREDYPAGDPRLKRIDAQQKELRRMLDLKAGTPASSSSDLAALMSILKQ